MSAVSLIPNQTNINQTQYFFLEANVSTLNVNNISTGNITSGNINTSTLSSGTAFIHDCETSTLYALTLQLDNQVLTANPTELLLNGVPLATTSNLSSIADWSLDPAISTVNMDGNNIINLNSITGSNAIFNNLVAINSLFVSSYTSSISSAVVAVEEGLFSSLSCGTGFVENLYATELTNVSTLNGEDIMNFQFNTLNIVSSLSTQELLTSSVNGKDINNFSFDSLTLSTLNMNAGGNITLSNFGVSFASVGSAQLEFQWFYEASTLTSVFYDTTISSVRFMTRTPGGYTDTPPSRIFCPEIATSTIITSSINGSEITTSSINIQVAGVSSLVANTVSSIGAELKQALVSTVQFNAGGFNPKLDFNFDVGSLVGGLKSGLTNIGIGIGAGVGLVGTGLLAAAFSRPGSTSINSNVYEQYATPTQLQFSTLGTNTTTFFRYVSSSSGEGNTVPGQEIIVSTVIPADTLCIRSLGDPTNLIDPSTFTSSIQAFGQWVPIPIEGLMSSFNELFTSSFQASTILSLNANVSSVIGLSSINGVPIEDYQNISSISSLNEWAYYPALSSISFAPGVSAVVQSANTPTDNIALVGSNVQLVANFTDAKNLLLVSSISTGTILGASADIFSGLPFSTPGLSLQAPNILLSTPNTIIPGNANCSTVAANLFRGKDVQVSTITTSTINVNNVSSGSINVSSLVFPSVSSVQLATTNTAGTQGQPAGRLVMTGCDLDAGPNDIWCNQIRVGAGQASAPGTAEVTFYDITGLRVKGLLTGSSDTTIRITDSTTPGVNAPGYLLDTSVNRPFFSTINQSTSMMAFFPSTSANTIGVSTISFMPPKVVAGNFASLSTQNITTNTPLVLWQEVTDIAIGGITTSTNTIVIPSPGIYEVETSIQFTKTGGAGQCDFWFRKNGVDLPNSASEIYMPNAGNGQTLGNVSFISQFTTGDKIQIVVASPDTGVSATFLQSTVTTPYTRPAVPSVITAIKCLNY